MASLTSHQWQGNASPGNAFNFLRMDFDDSVAGSLSGSEVTVAGDASLATVNTILVSGTRALFINFVLNDQTTGSFTVFIEASAFNPALDADISLTISWDASNAVTITESTPTPSNNAPSFAQQTYSFPDVAIAVNTIVGTVAATDADDDTLSYSLTGAGAANFAIDSDGQITVATALTNGQTYNFNVVANDGTDTTSVPVTVVAVAAAVTPVLGWIVPTEPVGNSFPVTLTSNVPLTGVELSDCRLRRQDAVFTNLTDSNATLTQIPGTNNYRIDIELTGTFDHDFQMRLVNNRVQYNGQNIPESNINSDSFHVDSSVGTTPTPPTFTAPSDYEVNERADDTIDSTDFFTGHTSLAFKSGTAPPSWVTISGLDVVITDTPDVTADTDYTVELTATNDDGDVDGDITIAVQQIDPAPVIGTIPRIEITEGQSRTVDVSGSLQNTDRLVRTSSQNWVTIAGFSLVITDAPDVAADTDYTINLRAESDKTDETDTGSVVIRVADVPPPQSDPLSFGSKRIANRRWKVGSAVDVTLPEATGGTGTITYSLSPTAPDGVSFTARTRRLTGTPTGRFALATFTYTATDGNGNSVELTFTIVVTADAITFVSTIHNQLWIIGKAVNLRLPTARGGVGDLTYSLSPAVPNGTTFTAGTRRITGTPTAVVAVATYRYSATDADGVTETQTFTIVVLLPQPPVWQTGTALKRTISAGESATVDIGALVPTADTVEEIFGLQFHWMDYNEATKMLNLHDAPIVREDTEIRIRFVASNADGDTPADYILTLEGSVLASLHNTLFFEEPLNYEPGRITRRGTSTIVTELTDNNKTTFSTHTDFDIDMADTDGNPTGFDYVGIIAKGSNLRVSLTPTGGIGSGFANRFVSQTIQNIGGGEVSKVVNGLLYDLYPLPSRVTATNVRLRLNGANIEIYAVMLLKLGWELDANSDFLDMHFDRVDRTGKLSQTPDGTIERDQVLGAEPFKFEAQYTLIMDGSDVDEWMDWVEANVNCAFAREFSRHPQDMFLSFFPTLEMPNNYLGLVKSIGETVEFGVAEQ